DFPLGSLTLEIHKTNPLLPTGIRFAAGVIIFRRVPPTFVRPAHAASSCSSRRPTRDKTPQAAKCSTASSGEISPAFSARPTASTLDCNRRARKDAQRSSESRYSVLVAIKQSAFLH